MLRKASIRALSSASSWGPRCSFSSLKRLKAAVQQGRCQLFSTSTRRQELHHRPKAVFLNAARLNYDNKLDFTSWHNLIDIRLNPADRIDNVTDILSLIPEGTEIVLTKEMAVPQKAVEQFPDSVKLMCECGTGYNNIPLEASKARNIAVCNVPSYSTHAVAHTAITFLLNFSASVYQQTIMLKCQKDRSNFTSPFTLPLHEVNGKVLGLVGGSGRIGTKVAEIALALDMHVIVGRRRGSGDTLPEKHALQDRLEPLGTFTPGKISCTDDLHNMLLPNSDYVSIHTPLNHESRHSFGRAELSCMKRTAFLINTSRGAVVHEQELIDALLDNNQIIAGAGLDVTEREPPLEDSPLYDNLPNVQLSPHTGWRRLETRQRLIALTAETLLAYVTAQSPADYKNVVSSSL